MLVGEAAEGDQPAGQGVAGGLVARHHQQDQEHDQLVVGELGVAYAPGGAAPVLPGQRALVERLGEDADDVVGRAVRPAGLDELDAGHGELAARLGRRHQHRVVGVGVAVARHHGVAPAVELLALVGVEAHELGDHDQRHVDGEVGHEVALAPLGDLVDDLVGQVPDVVGEVADHAGREALVDEAALPGVLGVVHGDDRHGGRHLGAHALGRGVALLVARDVGHVLVAGHDPQLVAGVPPQGRVGAQPAVGLPRVVVEARVEDVDVHGRRGAASGLGGGPLGERHGGSLSNERLMGKRRRRAAHRGERPARLRM